MWVALSVTPGIVRAQCPDGTPPPCHRARAAAAAPPANSVAVLYFENASRDSADAYLADGLTEEIISRLASIERLTVRSRYVVRRYRGTAMEDPAAVGRALNVAYLVSGSVRRSGGRLRVSAELIRASNASQVWGRQFDQTDGDVFAIQEAVSSEVAGGIVGRLLPAERQVIATRVTRDPVAYDHWLRGNFFLARRDSGGFRQALEAYQAAWRADSGFTEAVTGVALVYGIAGGNGYSLGLPWDTLIARAAAATDVAQRRAPRSPYTWQATALVRYLREPRTMAGVWEAVTRALALDTANAEIEHFAGFVQLNLGDAARAEAHTRRALALDPRRPVSMNNLSWLAMHAGNDAEALRLSDSTLQIDPDFVRGHVTRFGVLLSRRDEAEAMRELDSWRSLPELRTMGGVLGAIMTTPQGATGRMEQLARDAIAAGAGYPFTFWAIAAAFVHRGRPAEALTILEAARPRGAVLNRFLGFPTFAPLRGEPRYQRLLAESAP